MAKCRLTTFSRSCVFAIEYDWPGEKYAGELPSYTVPLLDVTFRGAKNCVTPAPLNWSLYR
jgi:hypothetical protein